MKSWTCRPMAALTLGFLVFCLAQLAQGRVLLAEDWKSGGMDDEIWAHNIGPSGAIEVREVSPGDYALSMMDGHNWGTSIMSRSPFPRGGNLRVTLKVWGDPERVAGKMSFPGKIEGEFGSWGIPTSALTGPWHSAFFETPMYSTLEAGVAKWWPTFTFDENRSIRLRNLPDNDAFAAAWASATSKDKALEIRVTLGDETGALLEWNRGDGWNPSFDSRGQDVSLRSFDPNLAAYPRINVGSQDWAKVGFVPTDSWILIDDILVENDFDEETWETFRATLTEPEFQPLPREPVPWTHQEFKNDPDHFQFVVTSDLTGGLRPGVFEAAVDKINLMQPEFVITVGDLVEGFHTNRGAYVREYEEFDRKVAELEMPFYYVPGNHDLMYSIEWPVPELWRERYGADYYSFVYRDVLFLCLNTNDKAIYTLGEEQIAFALKALRDHADVRWTIVLMHDPIWLYDWKTGWSEIQERLLDRDYTIFSGHFHWYAKTERYGRQHYILSVTGGDNPGKGAPEESGLFDHFMWVTMTDDGPLIANIALDGVSDDAVRTEEEMQERLAERVRFMEFISKQAGAYETAE